MGHTSQSKAVVSKYWSAEHADTALSATVTCAVVEATSKAAVVASCENIF